MALPELYDRVYWDNNSTPAINEDNLNALSKAVHEIDDRVIDLAGAILADVGNATRAEEAADEAEGSADEAEYWANVSNPPIPVTKDFASVITVDDAIPKAATDVKVKVEAVQDLHGYDKPWVGGAGKNKLPMTINEIKAANVSGTWSGNVFTHVNGVKTTILTDSDNNVIGFNINGTSNGVYEFRFTAQNLSLPAGSYIYSIQNNINIDNVWVSLYNPNAVGIITKTATSANYTCNGSFGGAYIYSNSGNTFNNVVIKPMLRLASVSDASYEPYENKCPISGFTEAKVTRTGKNLCNPSTCTQGLLSSTDGTKNNDGHWITTDFIDVSHGNYAIVSGYADGTEKNLCVRRVEYDENKAYILGWNNLNTSGNSEWHNWIALNAKTKYLRLSFGFDNKTTTPTAFFATNRVMVENKDITTASDYESYRGTDYIIDLDGTRYGATLDVTSGVMTVTHGIVNLADLTWTSLSNSRWLSTSAPSNIKVPANNDTALNGIASDYEVKAVNTFVSSGNAIGAETGSTQYGYLKCRNGSTTDTPTGQLVYELATPITVQLTPTEVQMLQGYNVLSANSGDVYLEYDASMIQRIANEKLDIPTFKSVVASSSDFADFKTKVAAL